MMPNDIDIDARVAALERHAHAATEALTVAIDHIRALTLVNAALMASLEAGDRSIIREAALTAIGTGSQHMATRAVVDALLQEPTSALAEHQAAVAIAEPTCRLQ